MGLRARLEAHRVDGLGRIDRRVVGRLLLAASRLERPPVEQELRGRKVVHRDQLLDQLLRVERLRVDRVVGTRVGDVAVHVEVLGDPHRTGGGDAETAGRVGGEGGGVEWSRRLSGVLPGRDLLDRAGGLGVGDRCRGLLLLPELVGRVLGDEVAVGMREGRRHLPEGHGLVRATLQLALHDQAESRALDAADGEEVGAETACGHRDRPGQRRAPDQVHVLPGGTGIGQRHRELVELIEGALDLVLGESGVAGALHRGPVLVDALGSGEVGVRGDDLLQCLEADQLALAVVVGRDHEVVGVGGDLLQGSDDVLVRGLLDQVGVDQVARIRLLPVVVGLGEGGLEDVALQADRHLVYAALVGPLVVGRPEGGALLGGSAAQDLGDLLRAVVLLGDYQSHLGPQR